MLLKLDIIFETHDHKKGWELLKSNQYLNIDNVMKIIEEKILISNEISNEFFSNNAHFFYIYIAKQDIFTDDKRPYTEKRIAVIKDYKIKEKSYKLIFDCLRTISFEQSLETIKIEIPDDDILYVTPSKIEILNNNAIYQNTNLNVKNYSYLWLAGIFLISIFMIVFFYVTNNKESSSKYVNKQNKKNSKEGKNDSKEIIKHINNNKLKNHIMEYLDNSQISFNNDESDIIKTFLSLFERPINIDLESREEIREFLRQLPKKNNNSKNFDDDLNTLVNVIDPLQNDLKEKKKDVLKSSVLSKYQWLINVMNFEEYLNYKKIKEYEFKQKIDDPEIEEKMKAFSEKYRNFKIKE